MHVTIAGVLIFLSTPPMPRVSMPTIMVSMVAPAPVSAPVQQPTTAPRPLPVSQPHTPQPQSLLASATSTPVSNAPADQAPAPVTPVAATPVAAPAAVVPPRFDAAYLDNPAPPYPPLARRMGEQGNVILRVLVSSAGTVEQITLKSGSGSTRLDQSALETVKRWRFVPARQGTEAVAAWVLVPISFSLGA